MQRGDVGDFSSRVTSRRFGGLTADEISLLGRPSSQTDGPVAQAETVFQDLLAALDEHGASPRDLTRETLLLRDIAHDLPAVLDARERVLDAAGCRDAPMPSFIEQPPLSGAALEVVATAVVPQDPARRSIVDLPADTACGCAGCRRSAGRRLTRGDETTLHTNLLYAAGKNTGEQAWNLFCAAEQLLDRCGMTFRDVVRTWIYLRDIDRDYDALNQARRSFFARRGVEPRPASTGVQGVPLPGGHDVGLSLIALRSSRPLEIRAVSTPTLNEAWSYGADFSRGLRWRDCDRVVLQVSGTASIDEQGRTVHVDDPRGQIERMLNNIAMLLAGQGASFADITSGVVYLKRPADAALLRSLCDERGFRGFPCAMVEAPLCRPELLCEAEAVALLPRSA